MKKPLIGITLDSEESGDYSKFPWYAIRINYINSIISSNGLPLMLPSKPELADYYFNLIDGILITGGDFDIDPKIYGEKKLLEMLVEQGAPKKESLEELLNEKKLRFIHITMALKESDDFVGQLEIRLSEFCEVAEKLEIGNPAIIRKWLSDDCKPCLVEHIVEGYDEVYNIMIELDNRLTVSYTHLRAHETREDRVWRRRG